VAPFFFFFFLSCEIVQAILNRSSQLFLFFFSSCQGTAGGTHLSLFSPQNGGRGLAVEIFVFPFPRILQGLDADRGCYPLFFLFYDGNRARRRDFPLLLPRSSAPGRGS